MTLVYQQYDIPMVSYGLIVLFIFIVGEHLLSMFCIWRQLL